MKKKILVFIIVISLCIFITGCGNKEQKEESTIVGGWEIDTTQKTNDISDDAKKIFDKAKEKYTGMELEAVALLGTQVVSGTNYMFLCKGSPTTETPTTTWQIVVVYNDLKDNASISQVNEFDILDYAGKNIEINTESLMGGWTVNKEMQENALEEKTQEIFNRAVNDNSDFTYTPIALMGKQVVAGTNYAILSLGKSKSDEDSYSINMLTIYDDLESNSSIIYSAYVNLADYNS